MWYTSFHKIGYMSDFGRFWSGYQIVLLYPPVSIFFQHSPPMRIFFIALLLSVTFRDFCLQGGFIIAKHLSFDSCSGIRSRVHVPPVRYLQRKIYFSRQSRFSAQKKAPQPAYMQVSGLSMHRQGLKPWTPWLRGMYSKQTFVCIFWPCLLNFAILTLMIML